MVAVPTLSILITFPLNKCIGKGGIVRVWNFETLECIGILTGHTHSVELIDVSKDGESVAVVGTSPITWTGLGNI